MIEWEPGAFELGRAVAALGVFDGVHIGHQALVRTATSRAHTESVRSVIVTFDRDPDQVVTPDTAAPQLLTLEDKLAALEELCPDVIVVVPFCRRIADTVPERFLDDVLMDVLVPAAIVVGTDFRFGCNASGNVETLKRFGLEHGFEVVARELVEVDGQPVTSTRIRALVADGEVVGAARLLGRPHRVHGRVVHGRAVGHAHGIPTANVTPVKYAALPAEGVYAGHVLLDDTSWPAGISVGRPPTFPAARDYLEAHLVDFQGDLYGRNVTVEFIERLRDQIEFDSPESLAEAIRADVRRVQRIVAETDRAGT